MGEIDQELEALRYAIHVRSVRLEGEAGWRIQLGIDTAAVYPRGPNALPAGTWRMLAVSQAQELIRLERDLAIGGKLASATRLAIEAAGCRARGADPAAKATIERAWAVLEALQPADVLGPWDIHARGPRDHGTTTLLELISQPSRGLASHP